MQVTRELEVHECPECFVTYAAPKRLFSERIKDGKSFFCPNGHSLSYHDTENDKLRRERDRLAQQIHEKNDKIDALVAEKFAAQKEAKRLATRATHGVCPCCNRTFVQLARHMKTKHPDYTKLKAVS